MTYIWGNASRSAEIVGKLVEKGLENRIYCRGVRVNPQSKREKRSITTCPPVRARVEHVFGAQCYNMCKTLVRGIWLVRVSAWTGLKSLTCDLRRLARLEYLIAGGNHDDRQARVCLEPVLSGKQIRRKAREHRNPRCQRSFVTRENDTTCRISRQRVNFRGAL